MQLNARGNRIGESTPRAGLTDHEVELIHELRAEGFSYSWLAHKFETPRSAISDICLGRRRCQVAVRTKEV